MKKWDTPTRCGVLSVVLAIAASWAPHLLIFPIVGVGAYWLAAYASYASKQRVRQQLLLQTDGRFQSEDGSVAEVIP